MEKFWCKNCGNKSGRDWCPNCKLRISSTYRAYMKQGTSIKCEDIKNCGKNGNFCKYCKNAERQITGGQNYGIQD